MKIFNPIDSLIHAMLGDLEPAGKAWARAGVVVLIVAAAMSFDFGFAVSWKHAVFLACLSFFAAFGPEAAYKAWADDKRYGAAAAIALVCVPLLAIEFYSHAGYTAGLRGHNLETAKFANVKADEVQEAANEEKINLDTWRKQLAELTTANAWAATVKADGLRAELVTLNERIDLEKKGQRGRKAGCGRECESLQNQRNDLERRIAIVEKQEDLSKRIEATQRILDGKRTAALKVEHVSSAVAHQNEFLAKAVALVGYQSLTPTAEIRESAQQSANIAMALAGTGVPAFALFVAGLYRRRKDDETAQPAPATASNITHVSLRARMKDAMAAAIDAKFGPSKAAA